MISLGLVDLIWTSNMILSHGHGHIFPCISMYSDWWSHYQLDKSIRWWSTATAFGGWWTPPYLPQLSWWWGPWVQERALSLRFRLVRNMKLWGKRRWFQRLELHNCWAEINPILRSFFCHMNFIGIWMWIKASRADRCMAWSALNSTKATIFLFIWT